MEHTSKSEDRKEACPKQGAAVRAAISFPPDFTKLSKKSRNRKVSLAWAVRDTSEKCVAAPMQLVSEKLALV